MILGIVSGGTPAPLINLSQFAESLSGDDPMTGAQASYLRTLCEQAAAPELFDENLIKAEASKRIDQMRKKAHVA